jgi:hypothetical protein
MQIQADPDPNQTFESQKVKFLHEKYTLVKRPKNIPTKVQKPFRKAENQVYL